LAIFLLAIQVQIWKIVKSHNRSQTCMYDHFYFLSKSLGFGFSLILCVDTSYERKELKSDYSDFQLHVLSALENTCLNQF